MRKRKKKSVINFKAYHLKIDGVYFEKLIGPIWEVTLTADSIKAEVCKGCVVDASCKERTSFVLGYSGCDKWVEEFHRQFEMVHMWQKRRLKKGKEPHLTEKEIKARKIQLVIENPEVPFP